jgi:cytoskeletal protein CcmA (bactofilin family)
MWGNKKPERNFEKVEKPERELPAVSVPEPAKVPENPAKLSSPTVEVKTMSTDAMRPLATTPTGTARLGASLHVKGEISGNEDLHIDGSVEGLIQLEDRKLTVGASAKVTADIAAREVVVYGSVKGNLRARDRIEIKKDGSVVGDLTTARIMIEDGAYFKGSIEIDRGAADSGASADKSNYARPATATVLAAQTPAKTTSSSS